MTLDQEIRAMGERALAASRKLAAFTSRRKNAVLEAMAVELEARRAELKQVNAEDVADAVKAGLSAAMVDRLTLTDARIDGMIKGIREVAALKDPVGKRLSKIVRPNGLVIEKRRVPLGVVAIIYESRPNVTADAGILCIKAGSAVILRGGKECARSNRFIADAMAAGGKKAGLPENAVQLVQSADRDGVRALVQLEGLVDVVIPRGGEALIRAVTEQSRIPVLKHYKGVCHVYVDETADLDKALAILENAKCQRPSACNAAETLLVHEAVAEKFLPKASEMFARRNVRTRGDATACRLIKGCAKVAPKDYETEYLDFELNVRVVKNLKAAVAHINKYGSHHSDAIVTEEPKHAKRFLRDVDSAAVYVNASTRFTDGGEFGMGAEMGISTDKLHARGPVGLDELTTYKYLVHGTGQVR